MKKKYQLIICNCLREWSNLNWCKVGHNITSRNTFIYFLPRITNVHFIYFYVEYLYIDMCHSYCCVDCCDCRSWNMFWGRFLCLEHHTALRPQGDNDRPTSSPQQFLAGPACILHISHGETSQQLGLDGDRETSRLRTAQYWTCLLVVCSREEGESEFRN